MQQQQQQQEEEARTQRSVDEGVDRFCKQVSKWAMTVTEPIVVYGEGHSQSVKVLAIACQQLQPLCKFIAHVIEFCRNERSWKKVEWPQLSVMETLKYITSLSNCHDLTIALKNVPQSALDVEESKYLDIPQCIESAVFFVVWWWVGRDAAVTVQRAIYLFKKLPQLLSYARGFLPQAVIA